MIGMAEFPDNYFDLAVVDPPYGIGGNLSHSNRSLNGKGKLKNRILNIGNTKWDIAPTKHYFLELFRVSKNQIIWGGNYFNLPTYRCVIVWDKMNPWENFSQVEIAWASHNKPAKIFKYDNRTGGKIHPTQKPVALYKWIYKNYLPQGGKVIDTHLGSGSNRIAANDAGNIDFYGYEIDKDYYEAQEKRFKNHISQLRFDFHDTPITITNNH